MTEERKTPDPGAADDPRVSDLYRDIASERAPEHLDRAILREAARAARPRYSRLRLWTRPAAWAAVVLLSATLLLQVSQEQVPQELSAPPVLELEDRAVLREAAEPAADAARQRVDQPDDLNSAAKATGTTVPRQEETVAEDMARIERGLADAPAAPAAASMEVNAFSSSPSADMALPACDTQERSAPESWLACIAALEEAGLEDAAEEERRLLAETFPDFEAP